jgi:hypothetical protein
MIDLDPADAATAQALAATRAELSPTSADKARLRAALRLPPAPPRAQPREATGPMARLAGLQASGQLGMALGALLFAAGVVTGWQLRPVARTTERIATAPFAAAPVIAAPAAAPALVPVAPAGAGKDTADDAATPAAAAPGERSKPRPRHSPATRTHDTLEPLDAELALLRRVERALRNDDPALALALLAELDQRFPQTRLAEERLAARTMAECRQHAPGAVLHAQAFLRERPASVYSERVQSACALETTAIRSTR